MMVSIVVAADEQNGIGINNRLPWRLSADLKYFRQLTTGHHIIMGRNTFESIGKPLPDRINIVLSTRDDVKAQGVIVVKNLSEALQIAQASGEKECMIIGGAQIYRQAIGLTDRIYMTRVHTVCHCDVFFPELNQEEWKLLSGVRHTADEKNEYDYSFDIYERIRANK